MDADPQTPGAWARFGLRVRSKWLRTCLAATIPPAAAFAVQWRFEPTLARWALFYPAVFISGWFGGLAGGLCATLISSAVVWWYFIPPERTFATNDATNVVAAVIFVIMGIAMSLLQHRLQRLVTQFRLFAALVENSTDFIGMADAQGNVSYVNPAGRQMVGLEPHSSLVGIKTQDFYPEALGSVVSGQIARETLENGRWEGETRFRDWRTDAEIPVWQSRFVIRDPDTKQLLTAGTVTRNLTEVHRSRQALEAANLQLRERTNALAESRRLLQAILDFSPSVIIVKDLEGRYQIINQRLRELIGLSSSDPIGKTDAELFPPSLAAQHRQTDAAVLENGVSRTYEEVNDYGAIHRVFLINKFPLHDATGRIFGIGAIWSEITERKRAEDALRQREASLRSAERIAHLGSWSWNKRDDTARWSEEMYRLMGVDPALPPPALLATDTKLLTEESLGRLRAVVAATLTDGRPYEIDVTAIRPDGSVRYLAVRGDAVRDADDAVIGIDGIAQDVTELREARRLRDEWTSVIAHDLRQPIGVIHMAASALPEMHEGEMSDKEKLFVSRIATAGSTLARMVDDLLDLSRLEARRLELQRQWVNPRTFITETIGRLAHHASGRRVQFVQEREVADVFADPVRIGQVLGNLISNAIKYGEPGTDIEVRLEDHETEIEISVTNQGRGITPEEMPLLFGRFMRTSAARGSKEPGLGVGLYIARELVEEHNGRIWAESTPGKTTTFHVALPARAKVSQVA